MYCPKCGKQSADGLNQCPSCGAKFPNKVYVPSAKQSGVSHFGKAPEPTYTQATIIEEVEQTTYPSPAPYQPMEMSPTVPAYNPGGYGQPVPTQPIQIFPIVEQINNGASMDPAAQGAPAPAQNAPAPAGPMLYCTSCGMENEPDSNFCIVCGQTLAGDVYCKACGEANDFDSVFCISCGSPLN